MDLISDFESAVERIWEPVLKPPRTPVSNDLLGFNFVYTENERIYRRKDFKLKTFDHLKLHVTCYQRLARVPEWTDPLKPCTKSKC